MNTTEWKDRTRKSFTLKSGLDVTVRRLSPFALSEAGGMPGLETIPSGQQSEITKSILKQGLLSPKIGEGPEDVSLYDLSVEDVNEIVEAIVGTIPGGADQSGIPLDSMASAGAPQS